MAGHWHWLAAAAVSTGKVGSYEHFLTPIRLQMHATDPDVPEQRPGNEASEGCIRIPATLNVFLDRHGVLDAEYEEALAAGDNLWIIRTKERQLLPWPGRYMVIVDSLTAARPKWSPGPVLAKPKRSNAPHRPAQSPTVKPPSTGEPLRPPSQ